MDCIASFLHDIARISERFFYSLNCFVQESDFQFLQQKIEANARAIKANASAIAANERAIESMLTPELTIEDLIPEDPAHRELYKRNHTYRR